MPNLLPRLLDLVYPANCHLCQRPLSCGRHLCQSCASSLRYVQAPFCSRCGECYDGVIRHDFVCPNCHDLKLDFEFARAALRNEGDGRSMLHDFKYRRNIHLANELAALTKTALSDSRFDPYLANGLIVPVPLHRTRLRKRKFNQSAEIAASLAGITGLEVIHALRRTRNTGTQTRFGRNTRLENLRGAFGFNARHHDALRGRKVILLDDVFTTGATANECTSILLDNGARSVAVLTLLRG